MTVLICSRSMLYCTRRYRFGQASAPPKTIAVSHRRNEFMMRNIIRASAMKNYFERQHSLYPQDDNYVHVLQGENVTSDINEDDGSISETWSQRRSSSSSTTRYMCSIGDMSTRACGNTMNTAYTVVMLREFAEGVQVGKSISSKSYL